MAETHYPGTAARVNEEPHTVHHETKDINIRGVLGFGAGLIVAAAVIHLVVWVMFTFFEGRENVARPSPEYPLAVNQANRLPPQPRLQTNPREDLRDLRDSEDAILNSYGWVDKNNGVVHIPIRDAMKLAVQRGLPARTGK
jgi:hypothetical protein